MIDIEVVPEFEDKKCRYLAIGIGFLFNTLPLILLVIFYLMYGLYFGIGALIVGYIFTSVFVSKKRQEVIPFAQSEFDYTNFQIAKFYVKKELCYED
ncbi:MAG: hypothetical protein OIF32_08715 [Campylobacterales bacterium]|nr:hypothetical protein [Campylobacterales bacterium]